MVFKLFRWNSLITAFIWAEICLKCTVFLMFEDLGDCGNLLTSKLFVGAHDLERLVNTVLHIFIDQSK
jgi:hypothetical protein